MFCEPLYANISEHNLFDTVDKSNVAGLPEYGDLRTGHYWAFLDLGPCLFLLILDFQEISPIHQLYNIVMLGSQYDVPL